MHETAKKRKQFSLEKFHLFIKNNLFNRQNNPYYAIIIAIHFIGIIGVHYIRK